MDLNEKFQTFQTELDYIENLTIRNLVISALRKVDEKFFHAPASSTGKYHPAYSLGDGGLVRHTKGAVYFFKELSSLAMFDYLTQQDRDMCIAALILHDTCKSGVEWKSEYSRFDHPLLVQELLSDSEIEELSDQPEQLSIIWKDINALIESHMGQWNTNPRESKVLPLPINPRQKVVHLSDYLASRRDLTVEFLRQN